MREQLTLLREAMERHGITAWISMCRDAHGSEYIGAHDECVRFLSGFTGDSSTLLVLPEKAYLWTDGRYFIQGERELKGSGVELMKMGEPGVPLLEEFIAKTASKGMKLGFSGRLVGARQGSRLARAVIGKGGTVEPDRDPVDEIWKDRPPVSGEPVRTMPEKYTGRSAKDKLKDLRKKMKEADASVYVTTALDETAWITNLRGSDISCNPVFLSYLILTDRSCRLYVRKQALTDKALAAMDEQYTKALGEKKRDTLLFGDRFPFRYLTDDYDLKYYAAFAGCSAETEASFETVAFLANKLDELQLPAVITIDNSDQKIARTIINTSKSGSAKILTLDSMQSMTIDKAKSEGDYLKIMEKNLEVLQQALN